MMAEQPGHTRSPASLESMQTWAQHAGMSDNAVPKPSTFAIGERVFVPSAQMATTITEIVLQGDTFGYRLAGLGNAVIAEADMERISIDGRQKAAALSSPDRLSSGLEAASPPSKQR